MTLGNQQGSNESWNSQSALEISTSNISSPISFLHIIQLFLFDFLCDWVKKVKGQRPKDKMVGPRGWILVIGLLVFLTTGGECLIGAECCLEEWVPFIAPLLKAFTDHASDLKSKAFKDAMTAWVAVRDKLPAAELEDLCGGHMGEKCKGPKDKETCSCNKDTGHVAEGNKCVAEKVGAVCTPDPKPDPCKKGMHCEGKPVGECKPGGDGNEGGSGSGSYTPCPIMWVIIIGGLALIPPAPSQLNSIST